MRNGPFPGQCSVDDNCTRPVVVKKWMMCDTHYVMWRRKVATTPPCTLDWCERKTYAKGLCQSHYQSQRQGHPLVDPRLPKPVKPKCAGPECDRDAESVGLCRSHYHQQYIGNPLTVLRSWGVENKDGKRKCRTCKQWKDYEDDFYNTSTGHKQGECKPCFIARSAAHQQRRKLEKMGVEVA